MRDAIAIIVLAGAVYWSLTKLFFFGPRDEDGRK